jgi:hypothetical protein
MKKSIKLKFFFSTAIKRLGFILLITTLLSFSILAILNDYSREEVNLITQKLTDNYQPFINCNWNSNETMDQFIQNNNVEIQPIYLFDLLSCNREVIKNRYYGDYETTEQYFKSRWRDKICTNPLFLSTTWDMYGEMAIRKINSRISYFKANPNSVSNSDKAAGYNSQKFTIQEFWRSELNLLSRYRRLVTELDLLSENDLNYYVFSSNIDDNASSYDFALWLTKNKLIVDNSLACGYYNNELPNNQTKYPGDLLLLINRLCTDNPKSLSPKSCLTIAKKYIDHIQTTIRKLGYVN